MEPVVKVDRHRVKHALLMANAKAVLPGTENKGIHMCICVEKGWHG